MPDKGARFSSDYLTKEQMNAALLALPSVLQGLLGEQEIVASYGWPTRIHADLMYTPMRVDTCSIRFLIEDSIEQCIVTPGESDFRFEIPDGRVKLLFCHESDIHLDGSDDELLERFMATKPFSEMQWHTGEEVERTMS